jgi:uncharacterized membrane protein
MTATRSAHTRPFGNVHKREMNEVTHPSRPLVLIVTYILYLVVSLLAISPLIGVALAYSQLGTPYDWRRGHYEYLIRTFWIGLPILVVGLITRDLGIGIVILILLGAWYYLRCIVGLWRSFHSTPLADPRSNFL